MTPYRRICVFCGSSNDAEQVYYDAARDLGHHLAENGIGLVFGGGRVGMMGTVADAALEAGGEVYGVIPRKLLSLELGHTGCTELFVVDGMHARKAMMASLSDGFIAMPGGFGTFEELFEAVTWTQLEYHRKPVGLLNVAGYYDHLVAFVSHAIEHKFIRDSHRELLVSADTPVALMRALQEAHLPRLEDWIDTTG